MLLYILLGLAAIIVLILIVASTKPGTVHYERSITISAAQERILPHIADFHKWAAWSPWERKDPGMERTHSGPEKGKGAKYAWTGNSKVGEGSMEILNETSSEVLVDLRFIRPFKSDCLSRFTVVPQNGSTRLTWTMDGPNIFLGKVMSLFMNMDKMIGKDFEEGLAALKAEAEKN
jgi:Polyketide cyclase / dehydrase and lipid transport